jgi:ribose-phosphate pyrophosphokinase
MDSSVIFVPYIKSLGIENLMLAAPDIGGSKRVREFAKMLNLDMVICDKERKRANEVASMTVIGDVEGRHIVLIDDIVDTANTLCKAADLLREKGALNSSLEELVVCDTIPLKIEHPKLRVLSADKLFANAIRNVCEYGSISSLFSIDSAFQSKITF